MVHSPLTDGVRLTSDSSSRNGVKVDRFILHHAATTSLAAILALFQPGGRTVSANYALGNDGTLILTVDETRRAWTSSSAQWDGRAITIEVANSHAGDPWPVSDKTFDKLARLIADVGKRYNFPINDTTLITHQELYRRYGASYATACPGDMQRRKAELIKKANYYRAFPSSGAGGNFEEIDDMFEQKDRNTLNNVYAGIFNGASVEIDGVVKKFNYGVLPIVAHNQELIAQMSGRIAGLEEAVKQLVAAGGNVELDYVTIGAKITEATEAAIQAGLKFPTVEEIADAILDPRIDREEA